jgi:hypothetical protein
MIEYLSAHFSTIALVTIAVLAAIVVTAGRESISLWLQSVWHSLPLAGGIAWLARRERSRQGMDRMHADSTGVLALCGSYARYIRVLNRSDYDNNMAYLRKAGDLGRRPFPPYLRAVIFSMVLVEAAGLAYVLAGWTLPGASEVAQRIAAGGIGFLIAVILVFFTHWAGVEIYHSNQYRRDRREWIAAGRAGALYGPDLSLNDVQAVDDVEPAFRQRATRGHGKTSYLLTTITIIMVLAVGAGAAFVRGQVLEQELVFEAAARAKAIERFDLSDAADSERLGGGPADTPAVSQRAAAAKAAEERATEMARAAEVRVIDDEIAIKRRGGWGTLIILAVIFFFLQLLGIFFGYRYSFNGRLSKDAYRALVADRFSSYSELLQYYDRIADIAQSKVERLQQLIEKRSADGMGSSLRLSQYSFRDYLQARDVQRREKPLGGESVAASAERAPEPAAPMPVTSIASAATVTTAVASESATATTPPSPPSTAPEADFVGVGGPGVAMLQAIALPPDPSPRELLERAERLERERSADRASRGSRPGSRRRGPLAAESEAN